MRAIPEPDGKSRVPAPSIVDDGALATAKRREERWYHRDNSNGLFQTNPTHTHSHSVTKKTFKANNSAVEDTVHSHSVHLPQITANQSWELKKSDPFDWAF